jgi:hypothetical protein
MIEPLETRLLLSGVVAAAKPSPPAAPSDPYIYAPHAKVNGKTLQEWSARWWQSVFAAPVFAADGTTLVNPQLVDGDGTVAHAVSAKGGDVSFLYGAFDGQDHTRGTAAHPITIPEGSSIFMPIQNSEWSNPDTPSKESNYTTVPGNYTAAELAHFADVQTGATIHLNTQIDGHVIPEATLFAHRETAPIFSYRLPKANNIDQVFFGEDISGRVSPVAADGYYLMLRPLSPGLHTIVFGGQSVDLSATPPQLGASGGQITYVINVTRTHGHGDEGHGHGDGDAGRPDSHGDKKSPDDDGGDDDLFGAFAPIY